MNKGRIVFGLAAALVLLVALALWLLDLNPLSSEITVYSVYCGKDTGEEGKCISLSAITYDPSPTRQEVVYWTDTGVPTTLANCMVRDRTNWECWYKDKAGQLSMTKGVFHEKVLKAIPGKDTFDSVRYVSKWQWWFVKLGVRID